MTSAAAPAPVALSPVASTYAKASAAPNTRRAYAAKLKLWQAHTTAAGLVPFPADPAAVANWLATRAEAGQSVATLRTAVAAVRAGHVANGFTFDTRAPEIILVLRGIARTHAREQRQAAPLRGDDVTGLVSNLPRYPLAVRDGALLALGYIFAARRSELVGLDLERQGDGDGYLRIGARSVDLVLARSKTATAGDVETVSIPRARVQTAVAAIERWIALASITPGTPLFRRVTKSGRIGTGRLHAGSVGRILQDRIRDHLVAQGVQETTATTDAARYSGHSLRVGFATSAAVAGSGPDEIATVTRHASLEMPRRYAKRADALRCSPFNRDGMTV